MQAVDPSVSRAKFDRELARFSAHQASYAKRGWWLLNAEFPIVEMAFVTMNVRPATVALTARFDFTDYDVRPISVKFIDFASRQELLFEQLMTHMPRLQGPTVAPEQALMMMRMGQVPGMLQGVPGRPGFLCVPGVREYHENPGHTGDSWELHRAVGEGTMLRIAETIWQYGSDPIDRLNFEVSYQLSRVPQ